MAEVKLGDHVEVTGKDLRGQISFIGTTDFAAGKWIGVTLPEAKGKNDGSVQGKSYFKCNANCGIFVRQNQISVIPAPGKAKKSGLTKPNTGLASPKTYRNDSPEPDALTEPAVPQRRVSALPALQRSGGGTGLPAPSRRLSMLTPGSKLAPKAGAQAKKSTENVRDSLSAGTDTSKLRRSTSDVKKTLTPQAEEAKPAPDPVPEVKKSASTASSGKPNAEQGALIKDLEEKVAVLTAKRAEDKAKLKEMEKFKVQYQQMSEYKDQWSSKQSDLHEQLKSAKKEAKESTEKANKAEKDLDELKDSVEMLTLDKEMAEEKAEVAEMEMEEMKEVHEETKLELDLLKEEINSGGESGGGAVDGIKVKQMEIQMGKLKDAVLRLKEISASDRKELDAAVKALAKSDEGLAEMTSRKDGLESEMEELETMVTELTEQVDCSLGAEAMVEKLTDTNLELEDKLKRVVEEVSDLEALRDLNEELEEQAIATERELREELDFARNVQFGLNRKIEELNTQNTDLQQTIMQFRSFVNQLQAELREARSQISEDKEEGERDEMREQEFALMQAQLLETKVTGPASTIDVDFALVDVQIGEEEARLLKLFMPERFIASGGDYEALQLILLLDRLVTTGEVVAKVTASNLKLTSAIDDNTRLGDLELDRAVFGAAVVIELSHFRVATIAFQRCIEQCDPDIFLRLGRLAGELTPHLDMLNSYKLLLEKQTLDESVSLEPITQSTAVFHKLRENYFPDIQASCRELLSDHVLVMMLSAEGLNVSLARVLASLDRVQEGNKLADKVKEIRRETSELLKTLRRIKNFTPSAGKPFSFPAEILTVLSDTQESIGTLFVTAYETCQALGMYIAGTSEGDVITVVDIEDMIKRCCNKLPGSGAGFDRLKSNMSELLPAIQQVAQSVQDGDFDEQGDASTKSETPYVTRAKLFKEQFSVADQLKSQIEFKNSEMYELKKMVRIKGEDISQQCVKIEMLEKRLENARKDGDSKLESMKKEIGDQKKSLTQKEKQYNETLDSLQEDIDALEAEKSSLKVKLEQATKRAPRAITQTILDERASGEPGSVRVIVEDSPTTLAKLDTLQSYAQLVQEENTKLMASKIKAKMAALMPLRPVMAQPPVIEVEKDVNALHNLLLSTIANTKVIDITKNVDGKTPSRILSEQKADLLCMRNKVQALSLTVKREMGKTSSGFVKAKAGEFVTPEYGRVLKEKDNVNLFGTIRIPSGKDNGLYKVLLDREEISSLNATLLCTAC